jgi:class 3 adenylate cyclase
VGSERRSSLAEVRTTAHCDACQIEFALDFSQHVEAQFRVSPSLRKIEPRVYCASSPWFRPHVLAELAATGGAPRTVRMPLPTGELLVRTLGGARRRETIEIGAARPARLRVSIDEGSLSLASEGEAAEGEDTEVRIESASDAVVLFERSGWHADLVFGSTIASMPEFLDLFATEAPALGMELSVGTLTVLFSDLTGSTALYERIGDARAYAVVGEHFADMTTAVQSAGGAIVKTMGDAVMATFTSPADALTASCAMVAACERAHGDLGLSVKIGFHEGPCLAVRANDRLDYFGTTVNVAARLQAKAEGSEIVVIESLLEHPALAAMRRKLALPERRFTASLKGIQNEQRLVGLDAHDIGARTR